MAPRAGTLRFADTQSNVPNVSHDDVHRGLCDLAAECRTGGSLAVSRYANDAAKFFDATEITYASVSQKTHLTVPLEIKRSKN